MPYYDEYFATVSYDDSCEAVIGQMSEFTEGEEFREYMESLIDALEEYDADRMIADTSEFDSALTEEDQVWSVQDWAPRAEAGGLDHMALVMPSAVVAEMTIDQIVEMADDSINRELFDNVASARDWIAKQG